VKKTVLFLTMAAFPAAAATVMMHPAITVIPETYWGVADTEPMVVVLTGERASFSRLGDEQCLDKLLGTVPCDDLTEEFFTPPGEVKPPVEMVSTVPPFGDVADPYGPFWPPLIYTPPGGTSPPPEPPPKPTPLPSGLLMALTGLAALVALRGFTA